MIHFRSIAWFVSVENIRMTFFALGLFAVASMSLARLASADETVVDADAITPPHVLVHVGTVRAELEELRVLMGLPANHQLEMKVSGAAPREVYFQALTLFQKADRLCFEHTRERLESPEWKKGDIRPGDVYEVVDLALKCVWRVKTKYNIDTEIKPQQRDDAQEPTDVFVSIVQANRQLNLMLERRFAPSDVFEQVTRSIGYASRLLEKVPDAEMMPPEPAYERGKRPADVYRRLLECYERIRTVAAESGFEMLKLQIDDAQIELAEPSDVYDIASLIVAELAYLHNELPDAKPPREVYYVGRKFPADVYQRAGILEAQLKLLEAHAKEHPQWLSTGAAN